MNGVLFDEGSNLDGGVEYHPERGTFLDKGQEEGHNHGSMIYTIDNLSRSPESEHEAGGIVIYNELSMGEPRMNNIDIVIGMTTPTD
jgi:hypothetical protein